MKLLTGLDQWLFENDVTEFSLSRTPLHGWVVSFRRRSGGVAETLKLGGPDPSSLIREAVMLAEQGELKVHNAFEDGYVGRLPQDDSREYLDAYACGKDDRLAKVAS